MDTALAIVLALAAAGSDLRSTVFKETVHCDAFVVHDVVNTFDGTVSRVLYCLDRDDRPLDYLLLCRERWHDSYDEGDGYYGEGMEYYGCAEGEADVKVEPIGGGRYLIVKRVYIFDKDEPSAVDGKWIYHVDTNRYTAKQLYYVRTLDDDGYSVSNIYQWRK